MTEYDLNVIGTAEKKDLHVHSLSEEEKKLTFNCNRVLNQVYIMKDGDIIFLGTTTGAKNFIMSYDDNTIIHDHVKRFEKNMKDKYQREEEEYGNIN